MMMVSLLPNRMRYNERSTSPNKKNDPKFKMQTNRRSLEELKLFPLIPEDHNLVSEFVPQVQNRVIFKTFSYVFFSSRIIELDFKH